MKIFNKYITKVAVVIITVLFTYGCIGDSFDFNKLSTHVENEGVWGVPLVKTTYGLKNILNMIDTSGYVGTDENGLIVLSYSDSSISASAVDSLKLSNQIYDETFTKTDFDNAGGFSGGSVVMDKGTIEKLFTFTGATGILDSIAVSSMKVTIDVSSTFHHTGTLVVGFPHLFKNGVPYSKTFTINSSDGSFVFNLNEELSNRMLTFNVSDTNMFFVTYKLTLNDSGSGTVADGEQTKVDVKLSDINYLWVFGKLTFYKYELPAQEISLDFFKSFVDNGTFELRNPKLTMKIINSFGLRIKVYTTQLQLMVDSVWTDIIGSGIPTETNPWSMPMPILDYPIKIIPADTTYKITGLTSNIASLISQLPSNFRFKGAVNFLPNTSGANFFSSSSKVNTVIGIEIPFWGRTSGIRFSDTIDLDLNTNFDDLDNLAQLDLNLRIANGLPHSLKFQGVLMDSLYQPVDSLFYNEADQWIINSGVLGADSTINQETGKTTDVTTITYTNVRIHKLENVKFLKINIMYVTTPGTPQPYVKYYDYYGMDFFVNAKVKLSVKKDL